jgi:hypothetical protein
MPPAKGRRRPGIVGAVTCLMAVLAGVALAGSKGSEPAGVVTGRVTW